MPRPILALAIILTENLAAEFYNFVVDSQIPDEVLAGRGIDPVLEIEADVHGAVRARPIP